MLQQEQYERFISLLPKDISTSLKEIIREKANLVELKKGEILLKESSTDTKAYLILKGSCIRFIIKLNGDEKAIMFHTESFMPIIGNIYVGSQNSAVSYLIKANENMEVIEINTSFIFKSDLTDKAYFQFAVKNALHYFSMLNQIQNHLIGLPSEEFLKWLMNEHGFIFQRFSAKDIASFMGVTPTWLSLLKHK